MRPEPPTRDPEQLRGLYTAALHRLASLGVIVAFTRLPARTLSRWDPPTATLHIRDTAESIDIVWALADFWWLHTVGEHASCARRAPHLSAVS